MIFEHEEFCDKDHSPFDGCNTYAYDKEIGTCWCGAYGEMGKIHNRMIDGHLEECGEYL